MAERTRYQEKIIRNYYENADTIALQKIGEQISELYLSEGKARERVWKRVSDHLAKLKIPATKIAELVKKDDPTMVARLLEELLAKKSA
jgi:hypothetical protein